MQLPVASPGGSLDGYLQAIGQIPVLSAEEERELAERWREQHDLEAARTLVLTHLRFVVHIARGYSGYGLPLGDLVQEGNVGLMKAVKRFDPSLNVRLVSFAVHWIRAEIHEFILRNWRIVKVATTKAQRKLFFNLRKAKQRLGWLNREEVAKVAADLGVRPEQVVEMEARLGSYDTAFDGHADDGDDAPPAPAAYLADLRADPALQVEQDDSERHQRKRLAAALAGLDPRSRQILERRWLQEPKATLKELAEVHGVSLERVRQLEKNALGKLRNALAH
ncbi:MAG TPA: RNA polymerase sigma factor RpoH [Gammaproteobacteria bacterium]